MIILGIETSCDETAVAVVKNGRNILSSTIASSAKMHISSGGIIPERAARQQVRSILPVLQKALSQANCQTANINAIAATSGPGLIGSLLVGIETAKTLALLWEKPLVPVNHLVAHIYANWLEVKTEPAFPALALVVSGGHTDLVLLKSHAKMRWIGGTRDDAAGEAFDKCARLSGLPYPGGSAISVAAEKYLATHHKSLTMFPRPMIENANYDWSFSGLKTAVSRQVAGKTLRQKDKERLSAEVQEAIVDVLVAKVIKAVQVLKPKSLLLAGGVAANSRLREKFKLTLSNQAPDIDFRVPPPVLCTDNAAYIAACAYYNYQPGDWEEISAQPELTISNPI